MSTKKSEHVDRLIREHLTLNEGLNRQSRGKIASALGGPATGQAIAAPGAGEASTARVVEIRQELVQILQPGASGRG